ncbi:MAG: DMT family transporter [Alphaproteobacteria bacterium]|nr:DMT family transporter [Alphaproteobacteria bacterium]
MQRPAPDHDRSPVHRVLASGHGMAAVGMLFWAGTIVVVRWSHDEVPPIGLSFWRTLVGALVLWPFVHAAVRRDLPTLIAHWRMLAWLAFLLFIAGNTLLFMGLQHTTAINAGLINAIEPITILLIAVFLYGDPATRRQWAGIAVSLVGIAILVARGDPATFATFGFNVGDVLVLIAIVSWSVYANWLRKVPRAISASGLLIGTLVFGTLLTLPFYIWETIAIAPVRLTEKTLVAIGVLGVLSSAVGLILWNRAVATLGPGMAGLYLNLIPVYSVALAVIFLGETLAPYHLVGIAIIAAGLWLALARRRPTT